jgi:carbamoyltransferase
VGVVVWDGGMFPQVYTVSRHGLVFHGALFHVRSRVYQFFGLNVPPFSNPDPSFDYEMSVSGKMMAYAGLGSPDMLLVAAIRGVWNELDHEEPGNTLYAAVEPHLKDLDGGSILASLQYAIGLELVAGLKRFRKVLPNDLCLVGGAALNIKWNSMIRNSGLFESVWVPPFPNDAGSALGAAYSSMLARGYREPLLWDVYSGPDVVPSDMVEGWSSQHCAVEDLAVVLESEVPVTVVTGRAELGPRALGHRSILASPRSTEMKKLLNDIKGREDYRPVAPMCLEEHAAEIFDPGVPDPYMLFDHKVRDEWVDRIPAVLHLDGTARLQTVSDGLPYDIVKAFYERTGIPLLCNTSANHSGKGFFPDVESAMRWGKTPYVWSDGVLYERG